MKMFTKLALVSSMAISANAMAMQAMDDAALSSATGQDGISMAIDTTSGISIDKLYIHDNDGLTYSGTAPAVGEAGFGGQGQAGAIVIDKGSKAYAVQVTKQTGVTAPLLNLVIDSDKGTGTDTAFLNVAATVAAIDVKIGSIGVVASKTTAATGDQYSSTGERGILTGATANEFLTGLDLSLGTITANVQLGAAPQGAMIKLDSSLGGGLTISNLGIKDNSNTTAANRGGIYLDKIAVRGIGATAADTSGDIVVKTDISVNSDGLTIKNNSTQGLNVYVQGVKIGSQAAAFTNKSIGDIEVAGLRTGGSTIKIAGH